MNTVLLVEDELLVRELALEYLVEAGFEVTTADDGDEAAAILDEGRNFDLLFTDVRMPGKIDGWELSRIAKDKLPSIRVIYATGLYEADRSFAPTEAYVCKPYSLNDLHQALDNLGFQFATLG